MKSAGNHFLHLSSIFGVVHRAEGHGPGVEPGVADVFDPAHFGVPQAEQRILTASTQGRCGELPSNSSQPGNGALFAVLPSSR